jgi:hypothetical protein
VITCHGIYLGVAVVADEMDRTARPDFRHPGAPGVAQQVAGWPILARSHAHIGRRCRLALPPAQRASAIRQGEKGIRIHAPITRNVDGSSKVVGIKPTYVFDVSQTDELAQEAAA